jgi:hypothetical protein
MLKNEFESYRECVGKAVLKPLSLEDRFVEYIPKFVLPKFL